MKIRLDTPTNSTHWQWMGNPIRLPIRSCDTSKRLSGQLATLAPGTGINVKGTLFTVQKALPLMTAGSTIVINGSMVSIKALPGLGVYAATKAALRSFARTWSVDLKGKGIGASLLSFPHKLLDIYPQETNSVSYKK